MGAEAGDLSYLSHPCGWVMMIGRSGGFYKLSIMCCEVRLFSLLVFIFEISKGQLVKHNSSVEMWREEVHFRTLYR